MVEARCLDSFQESRQIDEDDNESYRDNFPFVCILSGN